MKAPFAAVLALAALAPIATAETFRCGSRIVSSDTLLSDLVQLCGEPESRTSTTEDVRARNRVGLMVVVGQTTKEVWTYARGTQSAPMVVTIIDGRIKSIERKK